MKKEEFLISLDRALKRLPEQDKQEILDYYKEIIEDKIESGQDESEAVSSVDSIEEIVNQVITEGVEKSDVEMVTPEKKKTDKRQLIILIVGSPLWVPLTLAAISIIFAAYICAWAGVFSMAVTEAALTICAPASAILAIVNMCMGDVALGFIVLGISFSASGIALIAFLPCIKLVAYSVKLTKKSMLKLVNVTVGGRRNEQKN